MENYPSGEKKRISEIKSKHHKQLRKRKELFDKFSPNSDAWETRLEEIKASALFNASVALQKKVKRLEKQRKLIIESNTVKPGEPYVPDKMHKAIGTIGNDYPSKFLDKMFSERSKKKGKNLKIEGGKLINATKEKLGESATKELNNKREETAKLNKEYEIIWELTLQDDRLES